MRRKIKKIINRWILPIIDVFFAPFTVVSAFIMKFYRIVETKELNMRLTKMIFLKVGVWPLIDHYYEPLFNIKYLRHSLREKRNLPGINFNKEEQIELLQTFDYSEELKQLPMENSGVEGVFYFNNPSYGTGDSEILYSMIRKFKPSRIIEIGSGYSTLIAMNAIEKNMEEFKQEGYYCEHICIEPYEMPWLEKTKATIVRKKLEDVDKEIFLSLKENDILFIDSSHIIRPQGDVLMEYLEILPILNPGVLIHIHDIFTPRDYMDEWLYNRIRFWNEQYLLEAFLSNNDKYKIVMAVNYLANDYYDLLKSRCPMLQEGREPGAFWIQKVKL